MISIKSVDSISLSRTRNPKQKTKKLFPVKGATIFFFFLVFGNFIINDIIGKLRTRISRKRFIET